MPRNKNKTLAIRTTAKIKDLLRKAAEREHRSIANMVEVLIREYCGRNGIKIPEQGHLFDDSQKPAKR
jgi:hypothetical protein